MSSPQIDIHEIDLVSYYGEEFDITFWVFTRQGPHSFPDLVINPVIAQGILSFTHMFGGLEMNIDFLEKNVLYVGHTITKKKGTQLDG